MADKAAAEIAAEALIARQKKHVLALFGHLNLTISKKGLEAFRQTFELKSPGTTLAIGVPLNVAESKSITLGALEDKDRPDAIFCMGDLILIGAMQAIYEKNLKVPEDISVITISNEYIPTLYNPKITFVETSGYKLGKLAFKRMMSCLAGNTFLQELTVESVLVEGGSLA